MKNGFSTFDVTEHLNHENDVQRYLEACVEEDPGDGSLIRHAISDIARARGMTRIASDAGITREGLYKALSDQGNPSFTTMLKVLHALGLTLQFHHSLPR